ANADWNDLPTVAKPYWVMLMVEMQKYLASNTAEVNLTLGRPLQLELDLGRYGDTMQRYFPPKVDYTNRGRGEDTPIDKQPRRGAVTGRRLTFRFDEARQPGVYEFVLTRKEAGPAPMGTVPPPPMGGAAPDGGKVQETVAYAYNIDARAEG